MPKRFRISLNFLQLIFLLLASGFLMGYAQDVGVTQIIAPVGTIDSGWVVTPQARIQNFDTIPHTFPVIFRIGAFYNRDTIVFNLPPLDSVIVNFSPWLASQLGIHITKCSTALVGDRNPYNDAVIDSVTVGSDFGIIEVLSPRGFVRDSTIIMPRVWLMNYGIFPETLEVWLAIEGEEADYEESVRVFLPPQESVIASFPPWLASPPGEYEGTVWIDPAGDYNPLNDKLDFEFIVAEPGNFIQGKPLPAGTNPKKKVKSGGALTTVVRNIKDQAEILIFAFKGNNTRGFFAYNVNEQKWEIKESIPFAPPPAPAKRVKSGASLCYDGENTVYALKGNNTLEFWAYSVAGNNWLPKPSVPLGSGKKVKGGAGLVLVPEGTKKYVYCLKGNKTNEFYKFDISTNEWITTLPAAPGGEKGFGPGSCIVYDSLNQRIYALKSKTNELFYYDVNSLSWYNCLGMPFNSDILETENKKAKDGTAMTIDDSVTIYALKGGTQEFWSYNISTNSWLEKDTIPLGIARKKVKGGGALAFVAKTSGAKGRGEGEIYALKGNNTDEMWIFLTEAVPPKNQSIAKSSAKLLISDSKLSLLPNPCRGKTVLHDVSRFNAFTIKVYNIAGLLLSQIGSKNIRQTDALVLNLSNLDTGVYILRFESADFHQNLKLIICD